MGTYRRELARHCPSTWTATDFGIWYDIGAAAPCRLCLMSLSNTVRTMSYLLRRFSGNQLLIAWPAESFWFVPHSLSKSDPYGPQHIRPVLQVSLVLLCGTRRGPVYGVLTDIFGWNLGRGFNKPGCVAGLRQFPSSQWNNVMVVSRGIWK